MWKCLRLVCSVEVFFLKHFPQSLIFLISIAIAYVFVTFSYFKVFQIVRQHQREVHNNATNIDMRKYRKSISNMLYIVAIFLISYVPLLCCLLMINFLKGKEEK